MSKKIQKGLERKNFLEKFFPRELLKVTQNSIQGLGKGFLREKVSAHRRGLKSIPVLLRLKTAFRDGSLVFGLHLLGYVLDQSHRYFEDLGYLPAGHEGVQDEISDLFSH